MTNDVQMIIFCLPYFITTVLRVTRRRVPRLHCTAVELAATETDWVVCIVVAPRELWNYVVAF